jgi:hypothetical protein
MKKRKLNAKWYALIAIIIFFVAVSTGNLYKEYYKQQIDRCMKAGGSYNYCERHLGR